MNNDELPESPNPLVHCPEVGDYETHLQNEDDVFTEIVYPSQRLGAVQRKMNDIKQLLPSKNEENLLAVRVLFTELEEKVNNFVDCCAVQIRKPNLVTTELTRFVKWRDDFLEYTAKFKSMVFKWIQSVLNTNVAHDTRSYVKSGTISSSKSSSSSARLKLYERKLRNETKQKLLDGECEIAALQEKYERNKLELERGEIDKLEQFLDGEESEILVHECARLDFGATNELPLHDAQPEVEQQTDTTQAKTMQHHRSTGAIPKTMKLVEVAPGNSTQSNIHSSLSLITVENSPLYTSPFVSTSLVSVPSTNLCLSSVARDAACTVPSTLNIPSFTNTYFADSNSSKIITSTSSSNNNHNACNTTNKLFTNNNINYHNYNAHTLPNVSNGYNFKSHVPKSVKFADLITSEPNFVDKTTRTYESDLCKMIARQNSLTEMLARTQIMTQLPKAEPEYFDGSDITKYRPFILSFERTIETRCDNTIDLYYLLCTYTRGKALELVKSCDGIDARRSYERAKKLLHDNFGSPLLICQKYLDKLEDWSVIKSEDAKSLEEFSIFLASIYNMMNDCHYFDQLNSWKEIHNVVSKLPWDLRKQFRNEVASQQKRGNKINLGTLVDFLNNHVYVMKLPLFGDIKDKKVVKPTTRVDKQKTLHVNVDTFLETKNNIEIKCFCCGKNNHRTDKCFFFLKKSLSEREKFVKSNNLCFACLSSTEHRSKNCEQKIECSKCGKLHPTSLHREMSEDYVSTKNKKSEILFEKKNEAQSFTLVDSNRSRLACPAIPIKIKINGCSDFVKTYLAIDTQSTACYIDEKLLKDLNIVGRESKLHLTTMESKCRPVDVNIVNNLEIYSLTSSKTEIIPILYSKGNWPFDIEDSPKLTDVSNYPELKELPFKFINNCSVGILIGMNVPQIVKPLKVVSTSHGSLYATKHSLGWAINGPTSHPPLNGISCFRSKTYNYDNLNDKIEHCFTREFADVSEEILPSQDDKNFLKSVLASIKVLPSNHFEIALPFKGNLHMHDNHKQVLGRFNNLQKKFKSNPPYFDEYNSLMNLMLDEGFIERVPAGDCMTGDGKQWFLTHHGVRHKTKGKLRVVFDCSLKYEGKCLNDELLQGPDLTNSLIGVLLRFRQGQIAISADIEKMFYMVKVPASDRNYLKFFWFSNDNINACPVQYRLTVHVFGAKSSPSCANYALRQTALCNDLTSSQLVKNSVLKSFYVDDLMKSIDDSKQASVFAVEISNLLSQRGFNLTKFISNDRNVLKCIPSNKLSDQVKDLNLNEEFLPCDRALGIKWNVERDTLGFTVSLKNHDYTKRGILSTIFSIYDPLFLISPMLIPAKRVFQNACELKLGWDETLPDQLKFSYDKWLNEINTLNSFEIPRCLNVNAISECDSVQLHLFCDGSETAYGSVAYVRCAKNGLIHTNIVMAKVRLTPVNRTSLKTVPRIELNAAKTAVSLYLKLSLELELKFDDVMFWSDSVVVLSYIKSESARFQRFVANRVSFIRSNTDIDQWKFVPGELNPADLLSRGTCKVNDFVYNKVWVNGPEFLRKTESHWPVLVAKTEVVDDDEEVKRSLPVKSKTSSLISLFASTSSWTKLRYRVAALLAFKKYLISKTAVKIENDIMIEANIAIWRFLQEREFPEIYRILLENKSIPRKHFLYKYNPFIDRDGLMRIGGRLRNAQLPYEFKHPIIVPNCFVARIYAEDAHRKMGHLGKEATLSHIRQSLHIIGATTLIKKILRYCLICKKVQGKPCQQIMADLPVDRISGDAPAFTNVGLDFFGPFYVSRGRGKSQEKRYGVIFTCLASRATHLEIAHSLDVDSFINALRRFISRRGPVKLIRSDNGTNIVAGHTELKIAIKALKNSNISDFCYSRGINWKFQPPNASHHGGVFERGIRTVRKIFCSLLNEFSNKVLMTDEILLTLFCEIEDIMNSRPLTAVSSDVDDLEAITPNHLLRLHGNISFPPGIFTKDDVYHKRRWRKIQHMADVFWQRYKTQYLPLLSVRRKWSKEHRSLKIGDLVLVIDQNLPRNMWCLGRVINVKSDDKGAVRSAHVRVSRCKLNGRVHLGITVLERPITKLIVLKTVEEL